MDERAKESLTNRFVPDVAIMPVLGYADVGEAVEWLCGAFGFRERLRIGDHRSQLLYDGGAITVTQRNVDRSQVASDPSLPAIYSVHVRCRDVHAHHERAKAYGARILNPPTDYSYGERQYSVEDIGGHRWSFSESIADVSPLEWGASLFQPD